MTLVSKFTTPKFYIFDCDLKIILRDTVIEDQMSTNLCLFGQMRCCENYMEFNIYKIIFATRNTTTTNNNNNPSPSSPLITLMLEAVSLSENSVSIYQITRCNSPEDNHLQGEETENQPVVVSVINHISVQKILLMVLA